MARSSHLVAWLFFRYAGVSLWPAISSRRVEAGHCRPILREEGPEKERDMSEAGVKPKHGETARTEPGRQEGSAGWFASEMAVCCGPDMAKMMQRCPCASVMKGR